MPRGPRTRVAPGIYRDRIGWAVRAQAAGYRTEKRFPKGTTRRAMQTWQAEAAARLRTIPRARRGTLAADAARYLRLARRALTSAADKERHLAAWVSRYGAQQTLALAHQIGRLNAELRRWRLARSASTCNHRRDALTSLITTLYGKRAAAEFVDLVRFPRPAAEPRWRTRHEIEAVLARLAPGSKTRARLMLMHWTGMRPSQMARLTLAHFHLDDAIPFVEVPRGKGGRVAAVPLTTPGVAAARAFVAAEAWGRWSCPSANARLTAAARRVGIAPFTVYQIRRSFATALRRSGADLADIQHLYGHTDPSTTEIYAPAEMAKHYGAIRRLETRDGGPWRRTARLVVVDSQQAEDDRSAPPGDAHEAKEGALEGGTAQRPSASR